jgi:flagellar biosynthesis GTPase FlhF
MATAPPVFMDPSQIHLAMPNPLPPSAPAPSQSRLIYILKILVGLFIALILGAILIFLVTAQRTSNGIDLRESNEKIAELQRESNERIARLQRESTENLTRVLREQQLRVENQRLERQENLTEKHRLEDRLTEQQHRQQDLSLAMEQSKNQLEMEQHRLQILLEEQKLAEQRRKEDISRVNANLLSDFIQEFISATKSWNVTILQLKVQSLITRLDPYHKSSLISFLYKMKYLNVEGPDRISLDLQGANLKDLDLDDMDTNSDRSKVCSLI